MTTPAIEGAFAVVCALLAVVSIPAWVGEWRRWRDGR